MIISIPHCRVNLDCIDVGVGDDSGGDGTMRNIETYLHNAFFVSLLFTTYSANWFYLIVGLSMAEY